MMGLGLGTSYTNGFKDPDAATKVLEDAVAMGVNYFDTAFNYKGSYALMAPFVEKRRKDIFLVSKSEKRDYDGFMQQFDATLKALRTDHIDLMHIHALDPKKDTDLKAIENGAVKAQRKLIEQKAIRFMGITGHSVAQIFIDAVKMWSPDCIMTVFPAGRPENGRFEDALLPVCVEHKMGIVAMKMVRNARNSDIKGSDLVRYALSLPGVHVANVGLDTLEHLKENIAMTANFKPMSQKERTAMSNYVERALVGLTNPWERPGYTDGSPIPVVA